MEVQHDPVQQYTSNCTLAAETRRWRARCLQVYLVAVSASSKRVTASASFSQDCLQLQVAVAGQDTQTRAAGQGQDAR